MCIENNEGTSTAIYNRQRCLVSYLAYKIFYNHERAACLIEAEVRQTHHSDLAYCLFKRIVVGVEAVTRI